MKKIFFLLLIPIIFATCKKGKVENKPLFLSKVFRDGLLDMDYTYSSEKKPLRLNYYNTNAGQSELNSFRLYQYNQDGLLEEITSFSKNNVFNIKYKLQYDLSNMPTRMDQLASDNSAVYYYLFDYNTNGLVSKYSLYNIATNKKTSEGLFTYDGQGNISKINRYSFIGNNPVLYDSTTYTPGNKKLPAHWNHFEMLVLIALPNGDRTFYDMISAGSSYYLPGTPPTNTDISFSERIYNAAGYLVSQHVMYEKEYVGPVVVTNFDMNYEYIE